MCPRRFGVSTRVPHPLRLTRVSAAGLLLKFGNGSRHLLLTGFPYRVRGLPDLVAKLLRDLCRISLAVCWFPPLSCGMWPAAILISHPRRSISSFLPLSSLRRSATNLRGACA